MKHTTQSFLVGLIFVSAFILSACGGGGGGTPAATTAAAKPLNDTGITACGDYAYTDTGTYATTGSSTHNNDVDCLASSVTQTNDGVDNGTDNDIVRAGQDALYGRDATNNSSTDGYAGFSFTKLDSNGAALAVQSDSYATTPWACVKDNVTGLIWEVKTLAGLQTKTYIYTWYNSTGLNDGGDHGIGDTGLTTTTGYETIAGTHAGSDNCSDNARCDTEKYVTDVNASNGGAGLCGATDWRLPSADELMSIANNSRVSPAIDMGFFPNTQSTRFWSSSPYAASGSSRAWYVHFLNGSVYSSFKYTGDSVRLVRGSQ